ncbi:MAG: hypothetical protein WBE70_19905, partial [Candidatus Acidiferrum sp.]
MFQKLFLRSAGVAAVLSFSALAVPTRLLAAQTETSLAVENLRCEYKVNPLGMDVQKPRLSWQLISPENGVLQTSYEIRVARSEAELAKGKLIWDSGKQESDASI